MSSLMEDRLRTALAARAEQVRPEDLRPLDRPVPPAHGPRRPLLVGLAAAACAAAVAGSLSLGGPEREAPLPPTPPTARTLSTVEVDIDGDAIPDAARIVRADGEVALVVDLGAGDQVTAPVPTGSPGPLLVPGDLGGGPGAEVVVPMSDKPTDLPAVYTWLDESLVRATYPETGLQGWRAGNELNRWAVVEDGLRTWESEAAPGDARYPYWDWSVDDGARLRPGPVQLGCAAPDDAPAPCPAEVETDLGPRGDLPMLLPVVEERLGTDPFPYDENPGSENYAQLQGDFIASDGTPVEDGDIELVVVIDGTEHRAPVPPGRNPWLVPKALAVHGDTPVFVVERTSGDTTVTSVFSFVDGELVELEPEGDVFLGSGRIEHQGELTEQRTWMSVQGQLFTGVLLDRSTRRHHLWRWDVGRTALPTDLGEACIDWASGDYGRCR